MIGDKIKLLREAKGLTQQQITQDPAFGIKQGTLSAYERNAREPNIETIRRIAEYFGVTSDYLIGISEHQTAAVSYTHLDVYKRQAIEYAGDRRPVHQHQVSHAQHLPLVRRLALQDQRLSLFRCV